MGYTALDDVKLLCRRFDWILHLNTTGSGGHNSVQYSAQLQVGYGGSGVMQQTLVQWSSRVQIWHPPEHDKLLVPEWFALVMSPCLGLASVWRKKSQ